jgi:tetratricopeptide (TPR) repeat protein
MAHRRARTRWLLASLTLIALALAFAWVDERAWLDPVVARVRARWVPPVATQAARAVSPPRQPSPTPQRSSVEAATVPSAPTSNADGIVESEVPAPSCETLLGQADGAALPRGSSAPEDLARAREFAHNEEFDRAESVYCRALTEHPEAVAIRVGLLELLLNRRDRLAAARYAGEFARAFPEDRQLGWLVGDTWAQNGEFARARTTWLGAMAGGGDEQAARQQLNLARADVQAGRFARAEREYRRAAILDPAGAEAPAGVAGMLLRAGDAPSAVAWARLALGRAPRSAALHLTLGDALQAAGDAGAAEQAWERALELDPGQRAARERLQALGAERARGGAPGSR